MKRKIIGILICMLLITVPALSATSSEDQGAALEIEIFGGLKTGAIIRNIGDTDALLVTWNISAEGGFIKTINVSTSGIVASLPPHNGIVDLVITLPADQIKGFGRITVKAEADSLLTSPIEKEIDLFLLFFFTIILP